jgi:hypothetical protein
MDVTVLRSRIVSAKASASAGSIRQVAHKRSHISIRSTFEFVTCDLDHRRGEGAIPCVRYPRAKYSPICGNVRSTIIGGVTRGRRARGRSSVAWRPRPAATDRRCDPSQGATEHLASPSEVFSGRRDLPRYLRMRSHQVRAFASLPSRIQEDLRSCLCRSRNAWIASDQRRCDRAVHEERQLRGQQITILGSQPVQ